MFAQFPQRLKAYKGVVRGAGMTPSLVQLGDIVLEWFVPPV